MTEKSNSKLKKRPTSFDVARVASVSRSSVSLVFNNVGGNRVSTDTRERILKAAHDLGYQPDHAASALRKGYSNEIAFVAAESISATVSAQGLASAQERAFQLGYSFGIYLFYNSPENERHILFNSMVTRRPVGIFGPTHLITRQDSILAKKMGIQAVVLQGFDPVEYAPTQLFPLKEAFYLAAKHLVERGHKHIAHVVPRTPNPLEESTNVIILDGLHSAVKESNGTITELPMDLDIADADTVVDILLSSPAHPTAIVGNRDEYCFFLLKALSARKIRIPRDMALVGINNNPFCVLSNPALTSVSFDIQTTLSHAVDAIDAIAQGKKINPEWLLFPPPHLVVRESS